MDTRTPRTASAVAAIAGAIAASACCIGPLVLALLGIGGAGALGTVSALEPYRPALAVLTLALLGAGWALTLRPAADAAAADDCGCERPRASRAGRRLMAVATGAVALALSAPFVLGAAAGGGPDPQAAPAAAADRAATLRIAGMTCASCAVTVEAAAQRLDGLSSIAVDVQGGTARVTFDGSRLTAQRIAAEVSATGFAAEVLTGAAPDGEP